MIILDCGKVECLREWFDSDDPIVLYPNLTARPFGATYRASLGLCINDDAFMTGLTLVQWADGSLTIATPDETITYEIIMLPRFSVLELHTEIGHMVLCGA